MFDATCIFVVLCCLAVSLLVLFGLLMLFIIMCIKVACLLLNDTQSS
jgi:hypothetical protein